MEKRRIPSSGEVLPIVGLGTWQVFNVGSSDGERRPLQEALNTLFATGGSVIDSSPMYGAAEGVVGDLLAATGTHPKAFLATKVWTEGRDAGIAQMQRSLRLLKTDRIDLMQVHNLIDWKTHLKTLQDWKANGTIRYVGVTHYTNSAHDRLAAVIRAEPLDFVQFNYSIDERDAEAGLLRLAADRGVAVLINRPLGSGDTLRSLAGKPVPSWAAEIGCVSWAQIALKYVASHPAVTCVIPATRNPAHMHDNALAGSSPMPSAAMRRRMADAFDA